MVSISRKDDELNVSFVHSFLTKTYWAKGRTIEQTQKSLNNSVCYGLYINENQIGFARVISDQVVFAYIMDVFIIEKERKKGYSLQLLKFILEDKLFKDVQQWYLKTRDAHDLYKKIGFDNMKNQHWMMEKIIYN